MLYQHTLTIPAATTVDAPYEEIMGIGPGTITRIRVEYPYGCGELAGVQLVRGINHIYPVSESEWASWNDGAIESDEEIEISTPLYEILIRGVNYDSLNDHTLTIAVMMTSLPSVQEQSILTSIRRFFSG